MKNIAFVTTSKGRLHHIRQTLPLMMEQGAAEIIVVDYDCPDRTGAWVEDNYPDAKVVRVRDAPGFCVARARNIGAAHASSDWLVFVDGDVKIAPGWRDWMEQHLQTGYFYRARRSSKAWSDHIAGTAICARSEFEAIGGYDEAFVNWGGEDSELYERLVRHGVLEDFYPAEFVTAIPHGDEERAGLNGPQTRSQMVLLNTCYRMAKARLAELNRQSGDLPLEVRTKLMDRTLSVGLNWVKEGAREPLAISYVVDEFGPLQSGSKVFETAPTFTIRVQKTHSGKAKLGRVTRAVKRRFRRSLSFIFDF